MTVSRTYVFIEWPHLAAHVAGGGERTVVVCDEGRAVDASAPLPDWQTGMPLGRARRLYAEVTFVRRNRARENAAHTALAAHLVRFSPRMKAECPGCFLIQDADLDGLSCFVARRRTLRAAAANHADWARIAICAARPGTTRIVRNEKAFLAETPVSVLAAPHGPLGDAGEDTALRLELLGLGTLSAVRQRLSRRHLRVQFGADTGAILDGLLRPRERAVVPFWQFPRRVHATREFELPTPVDDPWIKAEALRLAERLAAKLRGMAALTLALQAFVPGSGTVSDRYLSRRGLFSESDLRRLTSDLHDRLCERLSAVRAEVLSFRLTAGGLTERAFAQGNLFTPRTEMPALRRAVSLLQECYGQRVILHVERKESLFLEKRLSLTPFRP